MTAGEKIRNARINKNLTQKELADKLHITPAGIVQWENGIRNPKVSTLLRIADALDIDYRDLLDDRDSEKRASLRPMALVKVSDIDNILKDLTILEHTAAANGNPITNNQRKSWIKDQIANITHEPYKASIMLQRISERLKDPSLTEDLGAASQINILEEHQYVNQFIQEITDIISHMNLEGRVAILHHARELSKIPDYQKKEH